MLGQDINLADKGRLVGGGARRDMPVLNAIRERFEKEKPLAAQIAACLHVITETGCWPATLKAPAGHGPRLRLQSR